MRKDTRVSVSEILNTGNHKATAAKFQKLRRRFRKPPARIKDQELDARFWDVMDRLRGSDRREAVDAARMAAAPVRRSS